MDGEADAVVGGTADAASSAYGLLGGHLGAAFSMGYAGGGLIAEQLNQKTSWYDDAAAQGRATESVVTDFTGNETVGTVAGAAVAGLQSINPFRLVPDPSD
jgi:hypothetical protein